MPVLSDACNSTESGFNTYLAVHVPFSPVVIHMLQDSCHSPLPAPCSPNPPPRRATALRARALAAVTWDGYQLLDQEIPAHIVATVPRTSVAVRARALAAVTLDGYLLDQKMGTYQLLDQNIPVQVLLQYTSPQFKTVFVLP